VIRRLQIVRPIRQYPDNGSILFDCWQSLWGRGRRRHRCAMCPMQRVGHAGRGQPERLEGLGGLYKREMMLVARVGNQRRRSRQRGLTQELSRIVLLIYQVPSARYPV
jgi:hypothetical protein